MYEDYIKILENRLDGYRLYHSLEVAKQAEKLAVLYGYDSEKAYLAGLLHDITKNDSEETHLQLFNKFGIILNDVETCSKKLWHAISGSLFVKNELNITDEEIISAIRYHTTGKADMSLLEKIVYIADFTSNDRKYTDVDKLRNIVENSLDDAIIYALKFTINNLASKNLPIHSDTLSAYNYLIIRGGFKGGNK